MKRKVMILFCMYISYVLNAQTTETQKEIGLVFSDLNNFGVTFKTGNNTSLWRFTTLVLSGGSHIQTADSSENKMNNSGFGIRIGREYRKDLTINLEFIYGTDLSFNYIHSKSDYDDKSINDYDRLTEQTTYVPGINLVLGLNYVINDQFLIGAELLPYLNYSKGKISEKNEYNNNGNEVTTEISGFSYGLSSTSALISIVYRFNK